MGADRATLFARLEELGIASATVEHEPMFTVEQSAALRDTLPGDLLEAVLGVPAGSVTPFALINASAAGVIVVVDKALMDFAEVNCHPLDNTATTRLATEDLLQFIRACGHAPRIIPLG